MKTMVYFILFFSFMQVNYGHKKTKIITSIEARALLHKIVFILINTNISIFNTGKYFNKMTFFKDFK